MNAYYTHTNTHTSQNSDAIRKAFLANSRKKKVEDMISSLASGISSKMIWSIIFALKIISGIVCAVSFFSVLGLIENGSLSPASGIACTLLIAVLECLCFVPMGNRPGSKGKQK